MNELKDFDINEFIIGQNLYIEASAGTGKTYTIELLVEKMLQNNIPLSKILIVTYTEKATGELRDRIRNKIINCLEKNPNDLIFTKALQEVGNAQIFTIHSFCQNVLNNFAFETKSSLNLELVNDDNINNLFDYFIRDKWQKLNDFQELLNYSDFSFDDFKTELANAVKQFNLFDNLLEKVTNLKIDYENMISKSNRNKTDEKQLEKNELEEKRKTFVLNHFKDLIFEWQRYKKENNYISFSDMINLVHENVCVKNDGIATAFSEPYNDGIKNPLVERLRDAYRYAIIDEFQDTNQKQWDIFRKLFLESKDNNIIVVGDPKQSIFSFQGAEIEVYKKAIDEIGNGRRLSTNYRSSEVMIEACNILFNEEIDIERISGRSKNKKVEIVREKNCFFGNSGIVYNRSEFPDNDSESKNKKATLNSKDVEPIWLANPSDEREYAKYAVSKLVECLKCDENGKTALQIYDKYEKKMRSVKFSDFAVLARTRSEMPFIENEMRNIGIPFYRYKDTSLFDGRECKEWISLLMLLDAPDFASYNRRILNQALLTDFFNVKLDDVECEEYVNPTKKPMSYIIEWRKLAEKRLWAELKEKIFEDTRIESYLSSKLKASGLVKIRQIANYIFDYLFNHKVSIEEIIKHLNGLASKTEETDSEGELVENANDLDAVKIMTIHASKGLEFPVVIMVGSLKGINSFAKGPFIYNKEKDKYIGFDKDLKNSEDCLEWRRLLYVAYTRAKYILILPDFSLRTYRAWRGETGAFNYLTNRMNNLRLNKNYIRNIDNSWGELQKDGFSYNINSNLNEIIKDYIDRINIVKNKIVSTKEDAENQIKDLLTSLPNLKTYQTSYSSISSNIKGKYEKYSSDKLQESLSEEMAISEDFGRLDKEDSIDDNLNENDSFILEKFKKIDNPDNIIKACSNYSSNIKNENDSTNNYPKGARLGNAIHEIFELICFENFGKYKEEDIYNIPELNSLIIECFEKQSLPIKTNNNWIEKSIQIVWNTLNADLPVIHGNKVIDDKTFKLKSLSDNARKSEVEFLFDIITSESNCAKSLSQESSLRASERGVAIQCNDNYKKLNKLCKGFIDLLFVRKENGIDYYSILDWKSDYMDDENYSDGEALAEKVAEEYTVQRVLYSYLLIKWLKQFYSDLSEDEIFEQHFGGIYYAFVRGCDANCFNGIYAQTWKSYKALEESYRKLLKELRE